MNRIYYVGKRILQAFVLLWLVVTMIFVLFRLMPGDAASFLLARGADPETVAQFEQQWGLNEPIYVQYLKYMANLLTFDAGTSIQQGISVWDYVKFRLLNSLLLVIPGITVGYIAGGIWGTILGTMKDERLEQYGIALAVFVGTIPIFVTAILAVIIFGMNLDLFPTSGMVSIEVTRQLEGAPWWKVYTTQSFFMHYVLPFSVIAFRYSSLPALIMRTSVTDVKNEGFTYYHRITGKPKWKRLARMGRHASLPVITFYPLSLGQAIGGLVLIEVVFNWPGIGDALVSAIFARDFPVVQFMFLLIAAFIIFGNLVVDIVYGIIDPRVSVGDGDK